MSTPRWDLANAGAIPNTGRASGGHWFRRPRNIAARRWLLAVFGTLRGITEPPTNYDDLDRSSFRDRGWKRHRRTRWKPTRNTPP